MPSERESTLEVHGASLYFKVRGSGPMLLVVQGGDGDADGSEDLVNHLDADLTVVTYDRRGLSRSRLHDVTDVPRELATHGDDAHLMLMALTSEPVFVLGFSIGALIGLELASRHPEQVRLLIAHEPPAPQLLPDQERARAVEGQERVEEAYCLGGVTAAMRMFLTLAGLNFDDREPGVERPRPKPERLANLEFFLTHDAPAVRQYRLDLDALRDGFVAIAPAVGLTSEGAFPRRCALALARELETEVVSFPGGHSSFATHPMGFSARLREILGG